MGKGGMKMNRIEFNKYDKYLSIGRKIANKLFSNEDDCREIFHLAIAAKM
jgi:hypothetical protein